MAAPTRDAFLAELQAYRLKAGLPDEVRNEIREYATSCRMVAHSRKKMALL
jgi:hypothetical protein